MTTPASNTNPLTGNLLTDPPTQNGPGTSGAGPQDVGVFQWYPLTGDAIGTTPPQGPGGSDLLTHTENVTFVGGSMNAGPQADLAQVEQLYLTPILDANNFVNSPGYLLNAIGQIDHGIAPDTHFL